jgi:outer membrane protein OmpA-like peptidoglycan-associated protein
MMIFMLIAIVYMVQTEAETEQIEAEKDAILTERDRIEAQKIRIREIAVVYQDLKQRLYEDLNNEFQRDLERWGAKLDRDSLTVRFRNPDVLFEEGSAELRPRFRLILDDFFPRYAAILNSDEYRTDIEEVRIEGHTSSVWTVSTSEEDSYFLNMELSQARTRSTLRYVLSLPRVRDDLAWLRGHLTANGLSFSKLITNSHAVEDLVASRRVEFTVRTNAEEKIARIVEMSAEAVSD